MDYFEEYLNYSSEFPSLVLVRSAELKNFPREFLKPPVLDLGCGDGFFTQCLGVSNIYGCDINKNVIEKAKKRDKVYASVVVCDSRDLLSSFPENSFKTVISNCVLEHIENLDKSLDSIASILEKGGHLIFSVPSDNLNHFYFSKIIFKKIGLPNYGEKILRHYNKKQNHINIYPFEVWKKKLKNAGLEVKKHFFLFNKREYAILTFFDSFFGSYSFINLVFRKITPSFFKKFLWRLFLKPIYKKSKPLSDGGELIIIAKKI